MKRINQRSIVNKISNNEMRSIFGGGDGPGYPDPMCCTVINGQQHGQCIVYPCTSDYDCFGIFGGDSSAVCSGFV